VKRPSWARFVGQPILAAAGFQPARRFAPRRFLTQETLSKGTSPARVNAFRPLASLASSCPRAPRALILPAQTLDQAKTLQKAHRYLEANDIFKKLVADHPDNPDYRVAWAACIWSTGSPTSLRIFSKKR